jgi:hypothetical protein
MRWIVRRPVSVGNRIRAAVVVITWRSHIGRCSRSIVLHRHTVVPRVPVGVAGVNKARAVRGDVWHD